MKVLILCTIVASIFIPSIVHSQVIFDSAGFESPTYSAGNLQGQGGWIREGSIGTATVQGSVVDAGAQAVRLQRQGSDIRFAQVTSLAGANVIRVEWSMRYDAAGLPSGSFGPYAGVEIYDALNNPGGAFLLAGSAGIDLTTGDILYQAAGTGILTESGVQLNPGTWNDFVIEADYSLQRYTVSLNGSQIATSGFVDLGVLDFTDAPIASLAAAGNTTSLNASGTAYFDNYIVTHVPEPGVLALISVGAFSIISNVRRRRK